MDEPPADLPRELDDLPYAVVTLIEAQCDGEWGRVQVHAVDPPSWTIHNHDAWRPTRSAPGKKPARRATKKTAEAPPVAHPDPAGDDDSPPPDPEPREFVSVGLRPVSPRVRKRATAPAATAAPAPTRNDADVEPSPAGYPDDLMLTVVSGEIGE